jgi:hypothetical protein
VTTSVAAGSEWDLSSTPGGAAPGGCRVVTDETLPRLRDAVRGWASAVAGDDQYRNPAAVRPQLAARKLNGRSSIEAYARPAIASS